MATGPTGTEAYHLKGVFTAAEMIDYYRRLKTLHYQHRGRPGRKTGRDGRADRGPGGGKSGDDLFVTNTKACPRHDRGGQRHPDQAEPDRNLSETLQTIALAEKAGYCLISHRSAETDGNFIADLAVATGAGP